MKALKILLPTFLSLFFMIACNDTSTNHVNEGASPGIDDSTGKNPTDNALDYHPDQRQRIDVPDSSNVSGTDTTLGDNTTSGSVATPNTGTQKSYNDKKGDSSAN